MNCQFSFDRWPPHCTCCGRKVATNITPIIAICRKKCVRGWGDHVADGLAAVGITKERVSKLVGRDCGCAKRQAALNAIGQKVTKFLRGTDGEKLDDKAD